MAPSGHPNRIREASPELRIALLGEAAPGICHQLGLPQPGSLHASLAPWPGPQIALEEFVPEGGLRHLGSGRLFAELAGGACEKGDLGNLPQVGAQASPERAEEGPGAWLQEQ